jgi:hypothetical protein
LGSALVALGPAAAATQFVVPATHDTEAKLGSPTGSPLDVPPLVVEELGELSALQRVPPLVVDMTTATVVVEVEYDPTAQQLLAEAHEMPVSAFTPGGVVCADQVLPPSVVATMFPADETAQQSVELTHEMPESEGVPLGRVSLLQVCPASVVAMTAPPWAPEPAAQQVVVLTHDTDAKPPTPPGSDCALQINPEEVVTSIWLPTAQQVVLDGHDTDESPTGAVACVVHPYALLAAPAGGAPAATMPTTAAAVTRPAPVASKTAITAPATPSQRLLLAGLGVRVPSTILAPTRMSLPSLSVACYAAGARAMTSSHPCATARARHRAVRGSFWGECSRQTNPSDQPARLAESPPSSAQSEDRQLGFAASGHEPELPVAGQVDPDEAETVCSPQARQMRLGDVDTNRLSHWLRCSADWSVRARASTLEGTCSATPSGATPPPKPLM